MRKRAGRSKSQKQVGESFGITDSQYKGLLLEDLENWRRMLELVQDTGNEKAQDMAQEQIDKINEKLKL